MKKIILLFAFLGAVHAVFSQGFSPINAPLTEREAPFDLVTEAYIFFDDFNEDTLHLRWALDFISIPDGWNIDLCDYGACYVGIPDAKDMWPAPGAEQPYLKLIVRPHQIPGSAWIVFRVAEVDYPEEETLVYFSLYTPGTVGVETIAPAPLRVFPNPAYHTVRIIPSPAIDDPIRIWDAQGRLQWTGSSAQPFDLDISHWKSGRYTIIANGKTYYFIKV